MGYTGGETVIKIDNGINIPSSNFNQGFFHLLFFT